MQSRFGAGYLFGIVSGSPVMFAALQDVSADFSQDQKMLYGTNRFPLETANGKAKIDLKASVGRVDPDLYNSIFFTGSVAVGQSLGAMGEIGTIPGVSTYTVTVANGANFRVNLGVYDPLVGSFMKQVVSGPAAGQYSVNTTTGVYTFAAADANKVVNIYYTWNSASTGKTLTVTNTQMGIAPSFMAMLCNNYNGGQTIMTFYKCVSSKLSMPFKQDDFMLSAFTFSAFDDGSGNVFKMETTT